MGKSLVIVESPAKAKTINKYLGNNFIVKSSVGHIRDLPTSGSGSGSDPKARAAQAAKTRKMSAEEKVDHKRRKAREQLVKRMGIDPENGWEAHYEILPGKEKVVEELRRLAENADEIFLATDLDREGEASCTALDRGRPKSSMSHHFRVLRDAGVVRGAFMPALANRDLLRLNYGIAVLHALLMACFVALPLALQEQAGLPREDHWWVYLTALLLSFVAMVPLIIYAERRRQIKRVVLGAILLLALTQPIMWLAMESLSGRVIAVILFFTAFNVLEATMPSMLSKIAPAGSKGTAMGIYSTSQFAGAALGGILGGAVYGSFGLGGVFVCCALLAISWLAIGATMSEPPYVTSYRLAVDPILVRDEALLRRVLDVPGVAEAIIVAEEAAAYIKVDTQLLDREQLDRVIAPGTNTAHTGGD